MNDNFQGFLIALILGLTAVAVVHTIYDGVTKSQLIELCTKDHKEK